MQHIVHIVMSIVFLVGLVVGGPFAVDDKLVENLVVGVLELDFFLENIPDFL